MTGTSPPAAGTVVVWITEGTWRGCVDAARALAPPAARIVLLHVTPEDVPGAVQGAYAGLLGRHAPHDPGREVAQAAAASATGLLAAAAGRLGRPCDQMARHGRTEREVVAAAVDAELLILARDGDRSRPGPRSLGPATRFAVDHAPCPVLLVWPDAPPGPATLPPPPGRRSRAGKRPPRQPPHPPGGSPQPPGEPPR
ncbi:MAG: universal stress protein [Gemmatimonadota bacterium]